VDFDSLLYEEKKDAKLLETRLQKEVDNVKQKSELK